MLLVLGISVVSFAYLTFPESFSTRDLNSCLTLPGMLPLAAPWPLYLL